MTKMSRYAQRLREGRAQSQERDVLRRSTGPFGEKATRLMSLAIYLNTHSRWDRARPMAAILAECPGFGDNASHSALEKRIDRAKEDFEAIGMRTTHHHLSERDEDGYTIQIDEPEVLPEGCVVSSPFERWVNILYHIEIGYRPTVARLAEYLGVDRGIIRQDINAMNMSAGHIRDPNSHLSLWVDERTDEVCKSPNVGLWVH
jgi:hypothetical protein